jgi:hypothetical protein
MMSQAAMWCEQFGVAPQTLVTSTFDQIGENKAEETFQGLSQKNIPLSISTKR